MKIVTTIAEVRKEINKARQNGKTIGFVPTMGALHNGHVSLVEKAVSQCDYVVVSIFVNPIQFGPGEDLDSYPRTIEADGDKCRKAGAKLIFAPTVEEMYPIANRSWVNVSGPLTEILCGASRPCHFRGVTTVCTKLFNIVLPDKAYLGQKDAQQLAVLRAMVQDLNMPLELVGCPIIREESGLAMSSRNNYLSEVERQKACILHKSLMECQANFDAGQRNTAKLKQIIRDTIQRCDIAIIDYIEIVDNNTFEQIDMIDSEALAAIAVRIGPARLIDNIVLKP